MPLIPDEQQRICGTRHQLKLAGELALDDEMLLMDNPLCPGAGKEVCRSFAACICPCHVIVTHILT
jgi:hypothetical protein